MAAGNGEARFPIAIPVETNATAAADSVRELRDSITRSKDSIAESAAALRNLRGKSDEVKAAKDQLTAKIRAEEAAVTASTLKLIKHGAAYKKSGNAAKDTAAATKESVASVAKASDKAGGAAASLKDKLGSLKDDGMALVAGAAAAAAAAILAVGASAASAAVTLAKFIIVSADAARMMQLTRKANLAGRDDWARNLGDQIEAIQRKVPIATEKLNELGISLAKSRIGGQTMVDTLNAVAGASAAAGDDLGSKLKGIVERGAFTKRFQLSPQELLGMDLDFSDVAKAYAEGMHVSVEKARAALAEGRVKLSDGAAALKKAVDAKFGTINADKLLGLDNQLEKFKRDLANLAKDIKLEPLLKGLKSLADNFDTASVNGKAMKGIITTIGNAIGVTFEGGVPIIQDFIDKAVYGALKIENYWLRAKIAFRETFGTKTSLEFSVFTAALTTTLGAIKSFVPGLGPLVEGIKLFTAINGAAGDALARTKDALVGLKNDLLGIDWGELGSNVVDGIADGLASGALRLVDKVKGLADDVKTAFTSTLKIQSPSKVFEEYGKQVSAGAAGGIEAGTPDVHAAAMAMAPSPSSSSSSSSSSRPSVSLTFAPQIVVQGGGGDVAEQLKDPNLLQPLYETLLNALRAAGIEVPA